MATIEFIQKRIEGRRKEIEKLEKKLERINKAKESNWENNPYYYHESDLKYTARDLESARKSLAKYIEDLEVAQEKANSRNVPAILEFLEYWKDQCREFYENSLPRYLEAMDEYRKLRDDYETWRYSDASKGLTWQEKEGRYEVVSDTYNQIEERFGFLENYLVHRNELDWDKINKDLNNEADRKYDFIIDRTNEIVGEITDASALRVGRKGDLNGYIIGTKGKAHIQTIGAGGYNIQCFHFRTLIHKA